MTQAERLKLPLNERYVGVTFPSYVFPDAAYHNDIHIVLRPAEINEYLPVLDKVTVGKPRGLKLLMTCMTHQEGFSKYTDKTGKIITSRSYKTNNPGNIGNVDNGKNFVYPTLEAGVLRQVKFVEDIAASKIDAYKLGKHIQLPPDYSEEIHNHPSYGLPYNLPGYDFIFNGELAGYVKIYATGARAGNGYVNTIVSYFHQNGIIITPDSKIQDLIKLV